MVKHKNKHGPAATITNVGSKEITVEKIRKAMKSMKTGKAPGEEHITMKMLKFGDALETAIQILLNVWKKVKYLFKERNTANIINYYRVSLLTISYKLFTKNNS